MTESALILAARDILSAIDSGYISAPRYFPKVEALRDAVNSEPNWVRHVRILNKVIAIQFERLEV
jgi:hypothetical protein